MLEQKKSYKKNRIAISVVLLLSSTFTMLDFLQSTSGALAAEQLDIVGNTSGNNIPSIDNFNLTSGYSIEPIVWNLTAPDTLTFDDNGTMYIGEAGYPFTDIPKVPRILKVTPSGNISVFVDRNLNSPIVDVVFHNGLLYVSHTHKVSTVNLTNGSVQDIIVGLSSTLTHPNNQIAFSPDGKRLYVGIGSATNRGVVGLDDYMLGWLTNNPNGHDIPSMNITLAGQNFVTPDPLTAEKNDTTTTGAFAPFGTPTNLGQVIQGNPKCNGCIISANLDGTDLKVVGWGFRNPTGIAFNEDGKLFAVNHGADQRGSRPIANDSDKFHDVLLNETAFYGWPDFFGNAEPVTDPKFKSPRGGDRPLEFLMQDHPPVEKPLMLFEPVHASGIQMAFANESFGFPGEGFVAQIGTDAPISRPPPPTGVIIGQNVVRVNVNSNTVSEFLSLNNATTAFRPTDVVFGQNGTALYIVDWGNVSFTNTGPVTTPNSGVVWKITPTSSSPKVN